MSEEPNNAEEQPQAEPEEPQASETPVEEQAAETPIEEQTPDASADQAADAAPADDVEAQMQAMMEGGSSGDQGAAGSVSTDDVEAAMQSMLDGDGDGAADASQPPPTPVDSPENAAPFQAPGFPEAASEDEVSQIDLLDDVELDVKIELGRTEMLIEDVLGLGPGSVVELDKAAGDPVDIYVNERLVARGEVLVLNDDFCVRINDILSSAPELEGER